MALKKAWISLKSNQRVLGAYLNIRSRANFFSNSLTLGIAKLLPQNKVALTINIKRHGIGFFAEMNWVLYAFAFAEESKYPCIPRLLSNTYLDKAQGTEWLSHYFRLKAQASSGRKSRVNLHLVVHQLYDLGAPRHKGSPSWTQLSIAKANTLFKKNLEILPDIKSNAENFILKELGPDYIALHYRGTDKIIESARVNYEEVLDKTLRVLEILGTEKTKLFVATDEAGFIDFLSNRIPPERLAWRKDIFRSADGNPLHNGVNKLQAGADKYQLGKDALIDCYILSKSRFLVRTCSFLSGWASVLNPDLPILLLNAPYAHKTWFPDNLLISKSADSERLLGL